MKSLVRLRVLLGLLIGLRWRDLESAIRFMNVRYPQDSRVVRLVKFLNWSFDVMWRRIPDSEAWVELSETISKTPYWLTAENPIADHPWTTNPVAPLPEQAEVVVVGAGFGGAAVAYHWSKHGTAPLVILERDQAASGSAGRNGGIVVMAGGALHGYYVYAPVKKYLGLTQPQLTDGERDERAACFADAYVKALQASHESIKETMESEGIECDYARKGWLFYTDPVAREGLVESSLALGSRRGYSDWVRRTPEQLLDRSGLRTSLDGAESLESATWHPAKWVWGILGAALRSPQVELFTRTSVQRVEREGEEYAVHTDRGIIRSRHVVNATEAHTPTVFENFLGPFPNLITPYKEQGVHLEGGPASIKPRVAVNGPLAWFTRIASGGMVLGSDNTAVPPLRAGRSEPSRFITRFCCASLGTKWEHAPMRVTHEWTGTTSTTPDKFPVIGSMDGRGLYIIGGFAGAGSAASFNGGRAIVFRILGKRPDPDYHPDHFFSPFRFTDPARYGIRIPE